MFFVCFAIDPILHSLNSLLTGFTRLSIPLHGPLSQYQPSPPLLSDTLKLISYTDDLKPFIRTMEEISLVIEECSRLELALGVQLHRDAASGKVKILLLGNWRQNVTQEDLPFPFIRISPFLDGVGVRLYDTLFSTRQMNSELLVSKVTSTINVWKTGRHMAIIYRAHTINAMVLSKIWYIVSCIPPRLTDIKK